jgi:undecaprenyl-diphosphatase
MARPRLPPAILLAAAGVSAMGFGLLARAVARGRLRGLDAGTQRRLAGERSRAVELAAVATTPTGKWWAHVPASLATGWRLYRHGSRAGAVTVVGSSLGAVALTRVLDRWFARRGPRPRRGHASHHSFPSGHALQSSAVALTTGYVLLRERLAPRWSAGPLGAVPLAAGAGKLLLARHFSTDVLAGYCAGIAWGSTCAALYELSVRR